MKERVVRFYSKRFVRRKSHKRRLYFPSVCPSFEKRDVNFRLVRFHTFHFSFSFHIYLRFLFFDRLISTKGKNTLIVQRYSKRDIDSTKADVTSLKVHTIGKYKIQKRAVRFLSRLTLFGVRVSKRV